MQHPNNEKIKYLESRINEIMEHDGTRGLAIGIIDKKGEPVYENFFGYRDAEEKLPVDRDTVFGLASVTKSFTTLAILKMCEDGKLELSDPISKYIPEFTNKNIRYPVRIWHLLCHSGGFFPLPRITVEETAREMGLVDSLDDELIYRKDFAEEGVRLVAERLDSQTAFTGRPGQRMSYCNDGFGLLSDIIRRYGGYDSYAEYIEGKILKPLGMTRSNLSYIRNSLDPNAAKLYSPRGGEWRADRNYQYDAFVLPGGGAMKSTLGDMEKYLAMFLNDGETPDGTRILSRYYIGEMEKPRQPVRPGFFYCYGLERREIAGRNYLEHGGSLPGVSSYIIFCPQEEIGIVVLCNTLDSLAYVIADDAMRVFCGFSSEQDRAPYTWRSWSPEELKELEGDYDSDEVGAFTLRNDNGILNMVFDGKPYGFEALYPWQGVVRKQYGDVYVTAVHNEEGHVFAARYGSRVFRKLT